MGDLKHWNLAPDFSGHEAAALAAGVDPDKCQLGINAGRRSGPPGYYAVLDAMKRAYEEALNLVLAYRAWPGDGGELGEARRFLMDLEVTCPRILGPRIPGKWLGLESKAG